MIFEPLPEVKEPVAAPAAAPAPERTVEADIKALRPVNRYDKHIWGVYICLCIISIIELYSASSREVSAGNIYAPLLRHILHLVMGFFIVVWLQRMHYIKFYKATPWIVGLSFLAMLYTLFNGDYINGARRSFSIILMRVQPAEFIKFSAVLVVAFVLRKSSNPKRYDIETWRVGLCAAIIGIFGAMLFPQGLTNTLLLMSISLSMMVVAAVSWRRMACICLIFAMLGGVGYLYKKVTLASDKESTETVTNRAGVWEDRITNFVRTDKYLDKITDKNSQEQYSYIAQAHGGIVGVGPGNSRETSRLSLAFSDYIYAIVVEEGGLILGMFVMILYLWLIARAATLAYRCNLVYPALLMLGMAVFIAYQALFHIAIVTGAFPVSGQPLPLISKGGTSIIVTSVAFGIMLSVSRFALQSGNRKQIKEDISSLPEDLRAINPSQS